MITNRPPANWGPDKRYEWQMDMEGYCVDDSDCGSYKIIASVFGYRNLLVRKHVFV